MSQHSNNGSPQSGFRFFARLVYVSVIVGLLVTLWWLAFSISSQTSLFETSRVLQRILIYSGVTLAAMLLLVFAYNKPLRFIRRLARWLFCWHTMKRGLMALAVLVFLTMILYVEENWRGKRAWDNYRREWEARGEHFDFAGFIPPPVPDEQNFALTPVVASCYSRVMDGNGRRIEPENTNVVNRLKMEIYRQNLSANNNMQLGSWQKSTLTDLKAWQEYYRARFITNRSDIMSTSRRLNPYLRGALPADTNKVAANEIIEITPLTPNEFPITLQPQTPATDVLLALSKNDAAIEELRQASRLPHSRFPLNYATNNPAAMIFPHYEPLKTSASMLRLRAVAELNGGQAENALADVRLIMYLAGSIGNEPLTWSLRMRMTIMDFAIQPIWEGLARRQWSKEQLITLNHELAGLDVARDYSMALRAQRTWDLKSLNYLRTERMANSIVCMCGDTMFWPTFAYRVAPSGWFYLNKVIASDYYQKALPTGAELGQRILSPEIGRRLRGFEILERSPHLIPDNWSLSFISSLEREAVNCARTQASVDLARVACALERYQRANGSFPESLDMLVPAFIPKVPHDIINGQPLHYSRTEDGNFLIYSVGWNEKDDGGEPESAGSFIHLNPNGDWVWRYPAK